MSIRIGIYDFFAYTVPGGLMLLLLLGLLHTCGMTGIWDQVNKLNTLQIFLLLMTCYLSGFVCSPFLAKWSRFFEPKHFEQFVLERFQKRNPDLKIDLNPAHWPMWLASIRRENLDLAIEIDRNMAVSKMIRGISLFLLGAGILALVQVALGRLSAWYIPAIIASGGLSWLTVRESIKFKHWFYLMIYEAVVSHQPPFVFPAK